MTMNRGCFFHIEQYALAWIRTISMAPQACISKELLFIHQRQALKSNKVCSRQEWFTYTHVNMLCLLFVFLCSLLSKSTLGKLALRNVQLQSLM